MKKIQSPHFTYTTKNIIHFCVIWFCVGFTIGTIILIYPVHWITDYSMANNWSSTAENTIVKLVILLFVIFSFFVSFGLLKVYFKIRNSAAMIVFVSVLASTTLFVLWLWFSPELMGSLNPQKLTSESTKKAEFFFGPYPTELILSDLKEKNYTLIISLLHPAVVPFEPKLLKDEEIAAGKIGIKFINIPMLPWVSDNSDALEKIKHIIKNEKGKIYVHCYLGKDRANVVKNIIKINAGVVDKSTEPVASHQLTEITAFERGEIIQLEPNVFLTPYPTDEEFFSYILTGSIKNVVNLMNPTNKEELSLVEKEKITLAQYGIPFHHFPLVVAPNNTKSVLDIVQKIKKLQRPILIHCFSSKDPNWEFFKKAYENQK